MLPVTWKELALKAIHSPHGNAILAALDIAFVNLSCAADLPGADKIDVPLCINTLNQWAEYVRRNTASSFYLYQGSTLAYGHSANYFRVLAMITFLQRDLDVKYNPAKMARDAPFDPADIFIHGVIQGDGGTCATLPIVYAAVGRRLDYPIKLVSSRSRTSGHSFCRWHDDEEQFNIEATGPGLSTPTDEEYRNDAPELYPEVERTCLCLVSKTPKQEMAGFLMERGWVCLKAGKFGQACEAYIYASALAPEYAPGLVMLSNTMNLWMDSLDARKPRAFPQVWIHTNFRHFPAVPEKLEGTFFGCEATEQALSNDELHRKWWGPMKDGQVLSQVPKTMRVHRSPTRGKMTFEMADNKGA